MTSAPILSNLYYGTVTFIFSFHVFFWSGWRNNLPSPGLLEQVNNPLASKSSTRRSAYSNTPNLALKLANLKSGRQLKTCAKNHPKWLNNVSTYPMQDSRHRPISRSAVMEVKYERCQKCWQGYHYHIQAKVGTRKKEREIGDKTNQFKCFR